MSFGLIDLALLIPLIGVCSYAAKKPEVIQRHRYAFATSLLLLGAGLALRTWWRS